jgi:hypothetical protein
MEMSTVSSAACFGALYPNAIQLAITAGRGAANRAYRGKFQTFAEMHNE